MTAKAYACAWKAPSTAPCAPHCTGYLRDSPLGYYGPHRGLSDHFPFILIEIPALTISSSDIWRIHTPFDRAEFLDFEAIETLSHLLVEFILYYGAEMFPPNFGV